MARQPGETIFINRAFRVVAEEADWLVVDKPPHLLVHPTRPDGPFTLWDGLRELLAFELASGGQISIINRLDRETSGLVLIAKNPRAARLFGGLMEDRAIHKAYLAIVSGHPPLDRFRIDAPLLRQGLRLPTAIHLRQMVHPDGAEAVTDFSVLERLLSPTGGKFALLRAVPLTGRTHQIRVHLAHAGFPIVGDKIYGPDERHYLDFIQTGWTPALAAALLLPRHALHSAELAISSLDLTWRSELAVDLAAFRSSLVHEADE